MLVPSFYLHTVQDSINFMVHQSNCLIQRLTNAKLLTRFKTLHYIQVVEGLIETFDDFKIQISKSVLHA